MDIMISRVRVVDIYFQIEGGDASRTVISGHVWESDSATLIRVNFCLSLGEGSSPETCLLVLTTWALRERRSVLTSSVTTSKDHANNVTTLLFMCSRTGGARPVTVIGNPGLLPSS